LRALAPLGVAAQRCIVAGAPWRPQAIAQGAPPPRGEPIRHVLLATNALRPFLADGQHYVQRVLAALRQLPDGRLTVCPPAAAEDAGMYRQWVAALGARATVRPGDTSAVLRAADVVIVFNSTVALEALACGTPVITLVGPELADSTGFSTAAAIAYAPDA